MKAALHIENLTITFMMIVNTDCDFFYFAFIAQVIHFAQGDLADGFSFFIF